MEIELKYSIGTGEIADAIWEDEELKKMEEAGSRRTEELNAIYYDTPEMDLLKHDIAFRIREEGPRVIATLKWNGKTVGALHTREELNVNLGEGTCLDNPDPECDLDFPTRPVLEPRPGRQGPPERARSPSH